MSVFELDGHRAVVTGASAGIGAEVVRVLAAAGCDVAFCARSRDAVDQLAAELETSPGRVFPFVADMADGGEVARFCDDLEQQLGRPDILVNNVGASPSRNFLYMSDDDWEDLLRLNLLSAVRCTRRFLPGMRANRWGRVIMVATAAAKYPGDPHLDESGADGIGLYRTELQFMLSEAFPRLDRQTQLYKSVIDEAGGKPVVFRTLDIGGDKVLPYLRQPKEENPSMGWRAIRMALDRPELFRLQVRALLKAAAGRELRVMIPMVSASYELGAIRALIEREKAFLTEHGHPLPDTVLVGAMFEVPALLFELDTFLTRVDFVSVGSNDLMQFLFAADRTNARVASRFDVLAPAPLRALEIADEDGRELQEAGDALRRDGGQSARSDDAHCAGIQIAVDGSRLDRSDQVDDPFAGCRKGNRICG